MELGNFGTFQLKKVGTKLTVATEPQMITKSAYRQIVCNSLLSNELGVEVGDNIVIIAVQWGDEVVYIATKGFMIGKSLQGARLTNPNRTGSGVNMYFRYADVYESMVAGGKEETVMLNSLIESGNIVMVNDKPKALVSAISNADLISTIAELDSDNIPYENADEFVAGFTAFLETVVDKKNNTTYSDLIGDNPLAFLRVSDVVSVNSSTNIDTIPDTSPNDQDSPDEE